MGYNSGFISRFPKGMVKELWLELLEEGLLDCTPESITLADDWEIMFREGNSDTKYGRQMYSPSLNRLRSLTMGEFYGDGIVD
jgi:hypothetical protein